MPVSEKWVYEVKVEKVREVSGKVLGDESKQNHRTK